MKKQSILRIPTTLLFAMAFIVIVVGTFLTITQRATANEPQSTTAGDTPISSQFTYQGELNNAGAPINGSCSMKFQLFDEEANGNSVSNEITESVSVVDGIFTVALDFGSDPFKGAARYLNIAVKCNGDSSYTTMGSRVALSAAPYALSLRPGTIISGTEATALTGWSKNDSSGAVGLYGYAESSNFAAFGVQGEVNQPGGVGVQGVGPYTGVEGIARSGTGAGYGVLGWNFSTSGTGVYGQNTAVNGATIGVKGDARSPQGTGVYGTASATSGTNYGVYGSTNSPDGYAIYANGNSHVEGDLTWKPVTSYLSIPAVAMQPNDETMDWDFSTNGEALYSNDVNQYFVAPVSLPHNATVTEIKIWWLDGSLNDATLSLRRINPSNPGMAWSDMVVVFSEGASGVISESSETAISNSVIDNSQYSYLLYLTLPDSDINYFQTVIEYTTTAPN